MSNVIEHNKTYMVETKRLHVRDIIRNLNQYTCKLMTAQDGSESYFEFYNKETREILKFNLLEFRPVHKITTSFIETPKTVQIGDRVDIKCMMYKEEGNSLKRERQAYTEEVQEYDDDDELVFNEHIEDRQSYKGTVSHIPEDIKNVRYQILRILGESPEGNISPSEVRDLLKKRCDLAQPENFIRKTMEELCQPSSERTNRKYILKSQFKTSEYETTRKKQKLT